MFSRSSRYLYRAPRRQRTPNGFARICCRAMAGRRDKLRWRPYPPGSSTPRSLVRERAPRMHRSAICGLLDTESGSIRLCCLTPRARSSHIRASTSPLAAESWVPPRGQAQRAATRAATCLRFRVLSSWADPGRSFLFDLSVGPDRNDRACPSQPGRSVTRTGREYRPVPRACTRSRWRTCLRSVTPGAYCREIRGTARYRR